MDQIVEAVSILNQNGVVAFPTETVYGLGARIDSDVALRKIFETKQRPFFDPLIVHVFDVSEAKKCFKKWNEIAEVLSKKFWPGPLTLVMEKSEIISDVITSGLTSVGVRVPHHEIALKLLENVKVPLAAPSANLFGKTSPTQAQHVRTEFGNHVFVIDSTPCEIGIESTVLLVRENKEISILRKGIITKTEVDQVLKDNKIDYRWVEVKDKKESPGHMKHHYMPDIPFVISKNHQITVKQLAEIVSKKILEMPDEIEGIKIKKPLKPISKVEFMRLAKDPNQAAREIYSQLRTASERKPDLLCLVLIDDYSSEKWDSIMDRLYKAASMVIESC